MRAPLSAITLTMMFAAGVAAAQETEPTTRQEAASQAQAEKAKNLTPYVPNGTERLITRLQDIMVYKTLKWHPFFQSAAQGGGMPFGVGYMFHPSTFNMLDVRGSYSIAGYKRAEAEFIAPRLFKRRGQLSVIGGWRQAGQIAFYGLGADTSVDDRMNYGLEEGHGSALLTLRPTRRYLTLQAGTGVSRWSPAETQGSFPSVDDVYTAATLPGLGATVTYLHSQGTFGFDSRPSAAYARRGGFYGITAHDYHDSDNRFGFRQIDYEVIQHVPILREAWTLSFRGRAQTALHDDRQEIPYFLVPHLGGGSTLRGFDSWRFRDRNTLLLQAEWRIAVNRFMDTAFFYDAGSLAAKPSELSINNMQTDYGFGARFHTPLVTAFRVEVARSRETTRLVFATSQAF